MSLDLDPSVIWRDFTTDGIPASGAHDPRKVEIRQSLSALRQAVIALLADADPGLTLPNLLIRATDTGAGTPNAIQATTNLTLPAGDATALIALNIFEMNTGSPVTVSFNGGAALTIKTVAGNNVEPGALPGGTNVLGIRVGTNFQLFSDQASAALLTEMEELLEDFQTLFLGVRADDPTTGPGGAALQEGALYYNSTSSQLRVYDGSVWQPIDTIDFASQAEAEAGTDNTKAITPQRVVENLTYAGIASAKSYGIKGDGTDQTALINFVLGLGTPVFFPRGDYRVSATIQVPNGGGIVGVGENTNFIRAFSSGRPVIEYTGDGGDVGQQPWFRRFSITNNLGQSVAVNDNGLEIGLAGPWGGRGDIGDITIVGQYDNFKWKGGTVSTIHAVRCYEAKRHNFFGVNPRGELVECHAEYGEGNGYYIFAENSGETGVRLINCGTFGNQEFGLQADAASGVSGANIWLIGRFSSSFDGRGGIYSDKPIIQFLWDKLFVEYAGYAVNFKPDFTVYTGAKGITLTGPNVEKIAGGDIEVLNCRGQGILIDAADVQLSGISKVINNGTGGGSGADRVGIGIQNAARVHIQELYTEAHKGSTSQTTDLAINTGDCVTSLGQSDLRAAFFAAVANHQWTGEYKNLSDPSIASASDITVAPWARRVTLTGTANLYNIAPTFKGHRIKIRFTGILTVDNGGNILQQSTVVTAAGMILEFECDGTNWWRVSQ
ncbi:glycoside hydrolase family 55 protein [Aliihoeflea sp. 40Bstr573]|uniref:glycoside hydrolase family 55 protein n=1 Tax=Aliihoeflea sp. 40Bstr573 TaxID=2696467 RepID=UPI002095536D|nr:glycoside hydrolase family 55 protein [Aliihoeflea sp. 40Bstr573]MCO6386344.1 hypothetical protein [Aliihoeflea sp. 40Bstr573]